MEAGGGFVWHVERAGNADLTPTAELVRPPGGETERLVAEEAIRDLQAAVTEGPRRAGTLWDAATRALEQLGGLRRAIRSVAHVGGTRERGKRLYETNIADDPWRVGRTGDRVVDVLLNHPDAINRTNELLAAAQVGYQLRFDQLETHAQVRGLLLEDQRPGPGRGNLVSLPDVGTGIAQLLPLAVQIGALSQRSRFDADPLLLVEQPELHLHPRLQGRLARLLVEAVTLQRASDIPGPEPKDVQFLIETHSEHLVLGLGVQVQEKRIPPGAVALLKMYRDERGRVRAERVRLTPEGRFMDEWPQGFFPERYQLEDGVIP